MMQYWSREKGITLIEVMIGMLIMTLGLLGVAPLVVLSIEANSISKDVTIASNLARDQIVYLEGLDSIPVSRYSHYEADVVTVIHDSKGNVLSTTTNTGYNRTTLIQKQASDSLIPAGLMKVFVSIDWVDKVGVSRQTLLTTYLKEK